MSPLPGADPDRDELAAKVLEELVTDPRGRAVARNYAVHLGHVRRPLDLLSLHTEAGVAYLTTTLPPPIAAAVLRDVADDLENGEHR